MSAFVQLVRKLDPDEERVTKTVTIPNGTREVVTERVCSDLVDQLYATLTADSAVSEIVYGPKILRELNRTGGEVPTLIVTAFAIVRRADGAPAVEGRRPLR